MFDYKKYEKEMFKIIDQESDEFEKNSDSDEIDKKYLDMRYKLNKDNNIIFYSILKDAWGMNKYLLYIVDEKENKVVGNRTKNIVPDVVGKNIEEAKKIFEERGFDINIISVRNDMYENGIVVKTNPGAGMVADKNNIIDVFVSSTY